MKNTKTNKLSEMNDDEVEAELEWITEALGEGYTKKQLAKQYGCSVPTLNKFLRGNDMKKPRLSNRGLPKTKPNYTTKITKLV